MSTPITGTQIKALFNKWNVPASYLSGFERRGRPASTAGGPFVDVKGIMIHHTASENQSAEYVDWLFKVGRADLPAPLCQFATNKKGLTYVGALGKANHAGLGSAGVLALVKSEDYDGFNKELKGGNSVNGNPYFYGNEVMYGGIPGQPMNDVQYKAVVRFCAALCDFHGWTAKSVIGHREWSSNKIDPYSRKMYTLRKDVQALLDKGPSGSVPTPVPPVTKVYDKMNPESYFDGVKGDHVTWLGERLVVHLKALGKTNHYIEGPGPVWGDADRKNVSEFQKAQGWSGTDADGFPGNESLKRLAANPVVSEKTTPKEVDPNTDDIWVSTTTWNVSGYNDAKGAHDGVSRVKKYISPSVLNDASDLVCFQELSATNERVSGRDMLETLDEELKGKYKRAPKGGKGQHIYVRKDRIKIIASGLFELSPRFNGNDKQCAWVVWEKYGIRGVEGSYHATPQEGRDSRGVTGDAARVGQAKSAGKQLLDVAKKYNVPESNVALFGDSNSKSLVVGEMEDQGWISMAKNASSKVNSEYKSLTSWKKTVRGPQIDIGLARKGVRVLSSVLYRNERAADHNRLRFKRVLKK